MEAYTTTNNITINTAPADKFKERVERYLKMSHQTLAELLAMRDEDNDRKSEEPISPNDYPWIHPIQPNQPYNPYPYTKWCPLTTGGQCSNPFGDCINCPYHGGVTYCCHNTNVSTDYIQQNDFNAKDFMSSRQKQNESEGKTLKERLGL